MGVIPEGFVLLAMGRAHELFRDLASMIGVLMFVKTQVPFQLLPVDAASLLTADNANE
jgi:hypothetical protein